MLGAVLHQELLLGGRRNRLHIFRWLYAGWLIFLVLLFLVQFLQEEAALAWARRWSGGTVVEHHASAPEVIGARFASFFIWQQILFLFLAVPIFTAGAIVDEKRQGTLQYLLLSDLESRHILLGKLLGRVGVVLAWLMAGLPLFALLAGFGGVEPITMGLMVLGLLMPIFGLAGMSLLASVYCRQTRDAVLAVYVVLTIGWLGVRLFEGFFSYFYPLWVLEPAWGAAGSLDVPEAVRRLVAASIGWAAIGAVCFAIGAARLLPTYRAELESLRADRLQWYSQDREPIDDEPVRWRELHVEGLAPNPTLRRIPQWLAIVILGGATLISSLTILYLAMAPTASVVDVLQALMQLNVRKVTALVPNATTGFLVQAVVVMLLASLIVGVRCAGAITQERERHTWEALLLTPLSAKQIVRGKLWGVIRASVWYLLAYAAPAVSLSVLGGPLALIYTLAWLAATVLAMYFIGATGLWCSARSSNSWRSLLQTMGIGYLGGLAVYTVTSPVLFIVLGVLWIMLILVDSLLGTRFVALTLPSGPYFFRMFFLASAASLVILCWLLARLFMRWAQRWIADRDRTRFVHDEPIYRRSRSPVLSDRQ
jgi:ABC-type transport system involved in multi-copper enzyme maturation permease subunit